MRITDASLVGLVLLQAATAVLSSSAQITAELAGLHAALGRMAAVQTCTHTSAAGPDSLAEEQIKSIGDGSGAGSIDVYQELVKKNWHGRLGRTHMVDVDRMSALVKAELDNYLRRTIRAMFPIGGNYADITPDVIFATLSAFGLRLEDRGALADVSIFGDSTDLQLPTIARLENYSAHYYTNTSGKFLHYWKASAMETLIELARYRGLFTAEGFVKSA